MTQEQLDIISKDLVQTIKLLKGNPHQSGLLFELGLIKNEMEIYNSNKTRNNLVKLILSCIISFFIGWITCSIFYIGVNPPIINENENKMISQSQTQVIQTSQEAKIELKNIQDFENKFDEFKFNGKSFSYKGQIFKEGDILGNIKIEYIIPNVHIRVWDIKEGYPFVKVISK